MEENSGINKKQRANTVMSALAAPTAAKGADAKGKAKHRTGRSPASKKSSKSDRMRVIEGGARKRSPYVKDYIGQQLKAIYDDVLNQPVPSRFTDLVRELAAKSKTDGQ